MRRTMLAAMVMTAALALGACGSDDDKAAPAAAAGPDRVTIGVLAIAAVTPLYTAMDQGFFEEENIEVEPRIGTGGAALLPSVLKGDYEFGFSNVASLVTAASKGLPVQIVANGSDELMTAEKVNSVVVAAKGGRVRSAKDLEGKTIAVNALENVGDLTIRASLDKRGIDSSSVKFREIPFPDMAPALESGSIDAAWLVEPFSTMAVDAGHRVVLRPYLETRPGLTISAWFTTHQFAERNPDLVARFVRALNRGIAYAQENPEDTRTTMRKFTKMSPEIAAKITLPTFATKVDPDNVGFTAELMKRYKMVEKVPDIDKLVRQEK